MPIKQLGYSLLEILVALVIFAIIGTVTSISLYSVFNTKVISEAKHEKLTTLQYQVTVVKRDLQQIFARVNGNAKELNFVRGGMINPGALQVRSELANITYKVNQNKFTRIQGQKKINLFPNLESASFSYLNNKNQWLKKWQRPMPPRAIKLSLNLKTEGEFDIIVPIYTYPQTKHYKNEKN